MMLIVLAVFLVSVSVCLVWRLVFVIVVVRKGFVDDDGTFWKDRFGGL